MNAEEFIEQYGKIEMMKMVKLGENKNIIDSIASLGQSKGPGNDQVTGRNSARPGTSMALGADIKEKMRQTLLNVQTYQTHKTNEEGPLTQSLKQN